MSEELTTAIDKLIEFYQNQPSQMEKDALVLAIRAYDDIANKVHEDHSYPEVVRYTTLLNMKKTQDRWKQELSEMI